MSSCRVSLWYEVYSLIHKTTISNANYVLIDFYFVLMDAIAGLIADAICVSLIAMRKYHPMVSCSTTILELCAVSESICHNFVCAKTFL